MLRILKNGVLAIGKRELEAHLKGEKLTYKQQVLAKCYDCFGGYLDGRRDCGSASCPNYSSMPYRGK
jgi:hypothetical protein|tara:strand:+ start:320 stop:520 length:201 start_codon:yes stop_codon:yes gene_type:complete